MDITREGLYAKIEKKRGSKLLVYVTGDRPGWETQIANDATGYIVEHLDKIGVVPKISLFLYTNGGNTLAGWNIVNLIRQFCDDFEILVPVKAQSTGTLMCLGANRIVMTKQATLGPIDPSINSPLNPGIPGANVGAKVPVSVEAIKGFLELAKHELNIKGEAASSSVFGLLAGQVHPLVLGEAYRALGQIQMLARKLLVNQVTDEGKINKVISFLCSESGSHDYTINRREASRELGLCIEKPDDELYGLIKETYNSIRDELSLLSPLDSNTFLGPSGQRQYSLRRVLIESITGGTDTFVSEGMFTRVNISPGPGIPPQSGIQDKRTFEGWKHYE